MNIGSHGRAKALSTSSAKRLGVSLAFAVLAGMTPAMAQDRLRASSGGAGSEMVYRLAFEGSTANESTGTVVPAMWIDGDPVYSTDAKVGASSFKTTGGCPAIIATDAAPLATTNTGYAITFWFKDDGAQSWSDFMGFRIGKGNYGFEMAGSGVVQLYDANLDSTGQGGGLGALVPAYSFAPSAWHHIAVVVPRNSNGTVNIYLDGGNKRTVDIPTYGKSGALNDFGAGQLTEVLVGGRRAKRAEGADPRTYLMGSPWLIDDLAIFTGDFTDGDVARMAGMQLVFAEEFNGDELDSRFWTPEHGLVRNVNARQMYLDDQSVLSVSNGALNITVSYVPGTQNPFYDSSSSDWRKNTATQDYKSAAIDSWGKLAFRYGHAEVRARYSVATGAWPALWLVGQDLSSVDSYGDLNVPENHHRALTHDNWPMVGEIDLQEYATKAQYSEKVNSTLHYGDSWEGAKYKYYGKQYDDASLNVLSIEDADWHVYTLDVDETTITIGYDGHTVLTRQQSELKNPDSGKYPFRDNHFYFIFNYALGSMSEEPPADGAGYPLKMEIDYVRLYQDPTKDNGLFFGNSALRHHVTSSYAGGVYAYREGDSMPLVYSTGNAVANMLTIEVLAELEKGESGAICGWLEGSHPVQLVYNAKTDRFDITYDGSTSHAKTVSYAPQDVTKPHVYTVAITAGSTGVKVYQDGVLIVDAPNIYWSGDQYKITDKLTIGSAADLTQLSPGMKVYAVDWYFPAADDNRERVFSTYGMTGSAAALSTDKKAMLASLAGGATSTTLPSVTVNGVVLPAAESVETLYAIGAPITSDKSLDFALTGMDPFAGNLTSRLSESLVKGSLTVFGSATLKDCWARVAAFPGATASDSDVLPVGDAIERGYRFFKSAIESGTPDTAGYENMMIANLPSKDFTVNYKKSGEQFRIPSLCRGGDTVVALYDMRPYADDLGIEQSTGSYSPIDIAGNVSSDGGRTWGESQVMIDVPNCYDYISGTVNNQTGHPDGDYDIGDVCTLFDEDTRTFFTMGITGGGLSARNSSDLLSSWDTALYTRGEAASAPFENRRSVRDELLEKLAAKGVNTSFSGNNGILAGPGHGIQTKLSNAGRLVFPMQYFGPDGTRVFAAYSDDHGATWEVTNLAPSGYNSQENCIAEMDDGSWYMIAKKGGGHNKNGRYLLRTVDFENWNFLGEFTPSSSVQGSLLKLGQRASDGKGVYAMAFCTTGGPGTNISQARHDLKMYFGVDAGESIEWNAADCVVVWEGPTGAKGYNSMTMVDADTVGILFEANGHIYFRQVDVHDRLR
ncbi:MAG: family 16 glycosylhydrolase [Kiritimatiellae bacterium]|nr:family 16 glycosylhydrolase [Kiritimatiellia bacterium]